MGDLRRRGFDFLHTPNLALIIGPLQSGSRRSGAQGGWHHPQQHAGGRIPDDGFLLLASVPYDEIGVDRAGRNEVAFPVAVRRRVIAQEQPALAKIMTTRTAVLDWGARNWN